MVVGSIYSIKTQDCQRSIAQPQMQCPDGCPCCHQLPIWWGYAWWALRDPAHKTTTFFSFSFFPYRCKCTNIDISWNVRHWSTVRCFLVHLSRCRTVFISTWDLSGLNQWKTAMWEKVRNDQLFKARARKCSTVFDVGYPRMMKAMTVPQIWQDFHHRLSIKFMGLSLIMRLLYVGLALVRIY